MTSSATADRAYAEQVASPLRWSRRDWAALLLLALLVALFFWRILAPNPADRASFPPGDFSDQFWAFSTFEARELSAGRLPLWNPYTYAGAPFWADIQSAVLYPPSLLTLLVSGLWGFSLFALEVEAILHFWMAGAFTYLFARRLTHHRGAAFLAATTFAFGGYLTGYPSQQLAVLETDVWLPLLLFLIDRALVERSGGQPRLRVHLPDVMAAGLAWGLALLAGHPQSALFVLYTAALYAFFWVLVLRKRSDLDNPVRRWLLLAPACVLLVGLGVSAVAWLPGLEYMRLSVRAAGFYGKMSGGFPLYDTIQLLLPGAASFYSPLYVGVLPLLLALWAALAGARRSPHRAETIFWGVLALGALLLSFGGETFLYSPLYLLAPGFSIFRDQERAAFIFSFALALLACYGFRMLIAGRATSIARFASATGRLLIGAVVLVALFFHGLNSAGWQEDSSFYVLLNRSVWLAILLALVWGVLQLGRGRETTPAGDIAQPKPRTYLAGGFLLIVALDLFTANWKTNLHPAPPESHTAIPAVVQAIQADATPGEAFRVYNEYRIYENYGIPYNLEDTWGASPLRLARYDELHRSLRMERVWELLNVKYVITWREELYVPSQVLYRETVGDETTYLHRLNRVAPRAWLVYQIQAIDDANTLRRLDGFDFDPARVALVAPDVSLPVTPRASREGELTGGAPEVGILHRTPTSLILDVSAGADGLLMLSEIHFPGWQATVDGRRAGLIRADYILRAIPIPAGRHQVEISYRPWTFTVGACISALTLLTLAGVAAYLWRRGALPGAARAGTGASPSAAGGGIDTSVRTP
jgi:hypothetical protein